jgi:hypothetical protein
MNIDGDNFNQPSLRGLGLLPAQSTSESVMGKTGRSSFMTLILYPIKNFTIKQATIEYNGQVYKTDPVKITVAAVEQPRDLTILVFQ